MKKLLLFVALALIAVSCGKEPGYTVTGTIDGVEDGMVYLQKRMVGQLSVIDSAVIKSGTFVMKGEIEYPQLAFLTVKDAMGALSFFLENSKINISGSIDSLYKGSVTGSKSHTEFDAYRSSMNEINAQMRELSGIYREAMKMNDQALADSVEAVVEEMSNNQLASSKDFIVNNPKSYVSPLILTELSYSMDTEELEPLVAAMDSSLNKVDMVITLKERIEKMKAVAVGQKAPDFTLNDMEGNPVSLYSKIGGKNKLLLVDFWASWCGPCRQENPNVVQVWQDYNRKGFDVFGVSLDSDGEAWKKGVADDKLTWTHVSDLKFWNCEPAKLYVVNSIPSNFLLDENGIIIGRNLRGDDLRDKVKEILDK